MSEETTNTDTDAPVGKPTVKKTTSRAKAASSSTRTKKTTAKSPVKRTATRKATNGKAPAKKPAASKKATATKAEASTAEGKPVENIEVIEVEAETASASQKKSASQEKSASQKKPEAESASEAGTRPSDDFLNDLKERDWSYIARRGLLMIFFGFCGWLATIIGLTLTFVHFIVAILMDGPNKDLVTWINKCGGYVKDVFKYLSYETDEPPFPLGRSDNDD